MTKFEFIKRLTERYGEYSNEFLVDDIFKYIEKYIDEKKLDQLLWIVRRMYTIKSNPPHPPIVGDIDKAIRDGLRDELEDNPRKKRINRQYDYKILEKQTDESKAKIGDLAKGLKDALVNKQRNFREQGD